MCVINHTFGFIFVHIPKNGGTSVAQALAPLNSYRDQEIGATDLGEAVAPFFRRRYGLGKHATLREIASVVGEPGLDRFQSFCVSRHPVHRVASTYAFLQRWTHWQTLAPWTTHVEEFLACQTLDAFVGSAFFATSGPDRLFLPQSTWTVGDAGRGVDRVLRLDRLDIELALFLQQVGVPGSRIASLQVPHVNTSAQRTPIMLSPGSLDLLRYRYGIDCDTFGYDLDTFQ
jgi:hypothetical protein